MEKLQKIIRHPAFWGSAGILVGVGVAVLVLLLVFLNPVKAENKEYVQQVAALQTEKSQLEAELSDAQDKLVAMGTDVTAKRKEVQRVNSEMALVKKELDSKQRDLDQKQADIEKVNKTLSKNKTELAENQKQLDKAKKGIQKLERLDELFLSYDSNLYGAAEELDRFYDALEHDNQTVAQDAAGKYIAISEQIKATYDEITKLLEDFRYGNY